MKRFKRIISPKGLLIFLCLTVILLAAGSQKVSSAEQKPYLIKVNRACNTITIYAKDKVGGYTIPVKAMVCSIGKEGRTITGTFQTKDKYRWKLLMGDVWGQYATRVVGGILFHSVYYYGKCNPATLATKEYNKLGTAASHGCIRLSVGDAKWIYDNCNSGTTVIIYDDKKHPGPLGKPVSIKLPLTVRWDPTDPSQKNPYKNTIPKIIGVKNISIALGEEIDLLKGVTAKSCVGGDITSSMKVTGYVDYQTPGKYTIIYSVADEVGRAVSKNVNVTVKDFPKNPKIVGVGNKLVNSDAIIDENFALDGVELYSGDKILDQKLITVAIDQIDEDNYTITYSVKKAGNKEVTKTSSVHVDREAPVIMGVMDICLEEGEIPSEEFALENITVSDNYSKPENITLNVTIDKNADGTYQLTYEAVDEAGNITTAQAKVTY